MLEIAQSEDGLWRYRWNEEEMWTGGFDTREDAIKAAEAELR